MYRQQCYNGGGGDDDNDDGDKLLYMPLDLLYR